ncbi:hypothetical protein [Agarilytica rhodophyticola]|uniref:hypothetical protein n=1 Tax=Agarilytica rhodophyticola TaxID=1737490 RepID=UPI000B349DFB|nr:hypothetical protein [Agarilytica rhodophyticola]
MNVSDIIKKMSDDALDSLSSYEDAIKNEFSTALISRNQLFGDLIVAYKNGDISKDDVAFELERERDIIEAEIITLEIIGRSTVQKAVNSAMSRLTDTALKII